MAADELPEEDEPAGKPEMLTFQYLWEKTVVAVTCLSAGAGSFEDRLLDAWVSALSRLDPADTAVDLEWQTEMPEPLAWVLDLCNRHMILGAGKMRPVDEMDRRACAEKLVHLLVEASRWTA
jgi:hypothetical protein